MNFFILKWCSWFKKAGACCVFLWGVSLAYATPVLQAPKAPALVYRFDWRAPETVFAEGFRSWASRYGVTGNTDLVRHVQGDYNTAGADRTTNWVSTTQSLPMIEMLTSQAGWDTNFPAYVWVYDISPTQQAFYAPWAFNEYLQRHPAGSSARADVVEHAEDVFGPQEEWSFRGGIPTRLIVQARRYDRTADGRNYRDSGARVANPAYRAPATPTPQVVNPVDDQPVHAQSTQVLGYESTRPPLEAANGTMDTGPITLGMSCMGISPSSASARANANYCYTDPAHVVKAERYTQAKFSRLAFTLHTGGNYCGWPSNFDGFYGVYLDTCSNAPVFLYDQYKRLYTRAAGLDWCMAASPSVVDGGSDAWDFVKLEPCALNSVYQKWLISDGKIYTYKGHYRVQDYSWGLMVSRKQDGFDHTLNPAQMSRDFFNGPSASQSQQVELQMGWYWNGGKYYSNFNSSQSWSTSYWNRSYYDYKTQRISYTDLSTTTSVSPGPAWKYCLTSNVGTYSWNWTQWTRCYDSDAKPAAAQQWIMKSKVAAYNNPDRVEWLGKNPVPPYGDIEQIWVQATGQPAGSYFSATAGSYWNNSTSVFSVRKDAIRFK